MYYKVVVVSEFKELIFLLPCPWIMAVRSRASTSVIALLQNNNGTSWAPRIEVAPVCVEGSYFCCLAYGGLVSQLFSALCLLVALSISDMQMTLCVMQLEVSGYTASRVAVLNLINLPWLAEVDRLISLSTEQQGQARCSKVMLWHNCALLQTLRFVKLLLE